MASTSDTNTDKTKRRRVVVLDGASGSPEPPTVEELLRELRGAIGQTLVSMRAGGLSVKERAAALSHMTRSVVAIAGLGKLDELDLAGMSDEDLAATARSIVRSMK